MAARGKLWGYLKAAFWARLPVPGLGRVPLNVLGLLGFGALGLLNPGFWLIGAGLEAAYLFSVSHHARFRALVDGQAFEQQQEASVEASVVRAADLPAEDRERIERLQARCQRVSDYSLRLGRDVAQVDAWSLASLQVIYAKLLLTRSVLRTQVADSPQAELDARLAKARQQLAAAPTDDLRLQQTLESTVDILKKRLSNLEAARGKLSFIEAELGRIEQQVELIVEEAALAKDAGHLGSYIDSVVQTFGETTTWLTSNLDVAEQQIEREARQVAASMQAQRQ